MKKILFSIFFLTLVVSETALASSYLIGRGLQINASTWSFKKGKVKKDDWNKDKAEAFAGVLSKDQTLYIGGSFEDKAYIWEKKGDKVESFSLEGGRVVYCLIQRSDGTIVAGGIHYTLGAAIWSKSPGKKWSSFEIIPKSTVISGIAEDSKSRLYVGGIHGPNGKVWIKSGEQWTKGIVLYEAKEINTLVASKGKVYAAGVNTHHTGSFWVFDGSSWTKGDNLKFSSTVYASCKDDKGNIYFVGAGSEDKVMWENSQGFWNASSLDDCLALYSAHFLKNGQFVVGGWLKNRRGGIWSKKNKDWKKSNKIEDCFVIRSICG